MEDLVSIVVPVYNAEKYIRQTVDCVLRQTYKNWELLLVDDGSLDGSVAVMKSIPDERIRVLEYGEGGCAALARNMGVEAAQGRYLAFLDADDLWLDEKLEKTLQHMKEKDAAFVFTSYEFGDRDAVGTGKVVAVPEHLSYKQALSRTVIFTSTVLLDLKKLGKEQAMMPVVKSEDTATWWRILKNGVKAYGLNENLVIYRRGGKSLSSNKLEAVRRIWKLYEMQEDLNFFQRCICFVGWAFRAVARRL